MDEPGASQDTGHWLSPGVGGIGLASIFSDSGHEIATAILPSFLATTLHARPAPWA